LLLAARGRRAFHEFTPTRMTPSESGRVYRKISYGPLLDVFMLDMRSYRGPNTRSESKEYVAANYLLGPDQMSWFKRALTNSKAVWKVIAADMPIGLISDDAIAQGDGAVYGREIEIADLLRFIKHAGIRNTVWLTADMHYTAAHRYDPAGAVFQDFDPFWEFVSGPIHAGTWGPAQLDNTFGPKAVFQKGCTQAQGENLAPCFGLQFFGYVTIDGATRVMTVALKDVNDRELWSIELEPILPAVGNPRSSQIRQTT
jgi:alkaline phosphatase D